MRKCISLQNWRRVREWNCNLNNQHVQDSQKLNRNTNEMIFIFSPFFFVFIGLKYEDFNVMRHLLDVNSDGKFFLLSLPLTHWFRWPFAVDMSFECFITSTHQVHDAVVSHKSCLNNLITAKCKKESYGAELVPQKEHKCTRRVHSPNVMKWNVMFCL